jgi:hypothetical protein
MRVMAQRLDCSHWEGRDAFGLGDLARWVFLSSVVSRSIRQEEPGCEGARPIAVVPAGVRPHYALWQLRV